MTPSELQVVLTHLVPARMPVLITGAPGIGKTDITHAVTNQLDYDLLVTHPVVDEPTDYKGFPNANGDHAVFLPFDNLHKMMTATKPTIVLLDDLGQAPPAVQAAAMQLLLARSINGKPISDHITFIACTNRKGDRAGVTSVLEPVKSRFVTIIELEPNLEDWTRWAAANGMPMELVGFINHRPDLLCKFNPTSDIVNSPTPRTVANAGKLIKTGVPDRYMIELIIGAVGKGWAMEFEGWRRVWRDIDDPREVLKNPTGARVPDEPSARYAMASALSEHVKPDTMGNFITYLNRLPDDFNVLAVDIAIRINPDLQSTTEFNTWLSEHTDVLI